MQEDGKGAGGWEGCRRMGRGAGGAGRMTGCAGGAR
jgi:hypothetical protein